MLKAIFNRVIVELEDMPDKSTGGIWIPQTAERRDHIGRIHAIGPDVNLETHPVKIGQRVFYNEYSELVEHQGKKYRVLKAENLLARLETKEEAHTGKKRSAGNMTSKEWENLD